MVAGLEKIDSVVRDTVDQSVSSGNAAGPDVGPQMFERLGLPDAFEGVASDRLHELEDAEGHFSVGLDPVLQVLHALILDDRGAVS